MKKNKILILEDDADLTVGLCYFLAKNGYTVEAAESVREAKVLLLHGQYDLLRRAGLKQADETPVGQECLVCRDMKIDLAGSQVFFQGVRLELTQVEYRLLCLLVRSHGRVVPREAIFQELWDGSGNFVDDNTLSVYVRRLRGKIETDPSKPKHLITARGFGYSWQKAEES